uniref:Uncharacterized protein n=1 Tax=Oryza glumipatula TaxID=40148 RepID=A0A0E0B3Y8_9ORYZ
MEKSIDAQDKKTFCDQSDTHAVVLLLLLVAQVAGDEGQLLGGLGARGLVEETCTSPAVSYSSTSPPHPLSRSAAAYAFPRSLKSSRSDTVTATREHASFRHSGAGMDSGSTSGSSMPYLPSQMNDHVASYWRRLAGSVVSAPTGFLPQK